MLTNDVISFEQPGPDLFIAQINAYDRDLQRILNTLKEDICKRIPTINVYWYTTMFSSIFTKRDNFCDFLFAIVDGLFLSK